MNRSARLNGIPCAPHVLAVRPPLVGDPRTMELEDASESAAQTCAM
jgi:hypothetical protein